ncbi:hypothetical protein EB796_007108 [Bugula neritina]|uniref:Uncharacterized protein n=1 Tax=Bugula neritina TaxID=10212 RepID=A0A7J7K8P6_BUGNE|nr:hypothetical protein EB796_007108 [Bugula neritina]
MTCIFSIIYSVCPSLYSPGPFETVCVKKRSRVCMTINSAIFIDYRFLVVLKFNNFVRLFFMYSPMYIQHYF